MLITAKQVRVGDKIDTEDSGTREVIAIEVDQGGRVCIAIQDPAGRVTGRAMFGETTLIYNPGDHVLMYAGSAETRDKLFQALSDVRDNIGWPEIKVLSAALAQFIDNNDDVPGTEGDTLVASVLAERVNMVFAALTEDE
jgi:hypothetical protein